MDMNDELDAWCFYVMGGDYGERTPRLTSPVLSASILMGSMLDSGALRRVTGVWARVERKLECSVSRIEGARPNVIARLRVVRCCEMNARRV
jgi:hypothetical protein